MRHDGWDQSRPDIVDKPITASATWCKSFPDGVGGEVFLGGDQNSRVNYCWIKGKKKKKFSPAQTEEDERFEGI